MLVEYSHLYLHRNKQPTCTANRNNKGWFTKVKNNRKKIYNDENKKNPGNNPPPWMQNQTCKRNGSIYRNGKKGSKIHNRVGRSLPDKRKSPETLQGRRSGNACTFTKVEL